MVSSKAKMVSTVFRAGTHRRWTSLRHVIRQNENPPEGVRAGSREPSPVGFAVTTERVRPDKRAAAGSGSSITPAASVTSRSGSPLLHLANPWARGSSVAPAVSSTGMADGGSGDAHTSNTGPTWAASEANLRDHAVRLNKRRGC